MVTEVFEKTLTATEKTRAFILQGLQSDKLSESLALYPTMTDNRCRELATNLERKVVNRDVIVVKPRYSEVITNNVNNLYRNRIQSQAD